MALVYDIQAIRDQVLTDLAGVHDYYMDTKVGWDIVQSFVANGNVFTNRNPATGTLVTEADLVRKAWGYVADQLAEATFQQFISIFESFVFDFLRFWLLAFPRSLGGKKVDFKEVLDAADKDEITLLVVNKELNEILYDRPAGWFAYLDDRVKLGCPTQNEIDRIAEAKATRDVLIHNRGIANKTYESKAGKLSRHKKGERVDIPEPYHRATWELICKVVTDMSVAGISKASSF